MLALFFALNFVLTLYYSYMIGLSFDVYLCQTGCCILSDFIQEPELGVSFPPGV